MPYGSGRIEWQYIYIFCGVCSRVPRVRPRSALRFRQDRVAVHLHFLRCVFQGATGKAKECLKLQEEGKMTEVEVQKVLHRADAISYGTLAEMNHFQSERVKDFKLMMQLYLRSQIKFYQEVSRDSLLGVESLEVTAMVMRVIVVVAAAMLVLAMSVVLAAIM